MLTVWWPPTFWLVALASAFNPQHAPPGLRPQVPSPSSRIAPPRLAHADSPRDSARLATSLTASTELLELQVSSPALLLNHMAERYASTSRILMEFVDNAFDDAESLYDTNAGSYSRPVSIDVSVSRKERTLRIVDNCNGMAPDTLSRVVMRVGESGKRGSSFVNGQFGFGMQAFRAACSSMTVRSRSALVGGKLLEPAPPPFQIRVDRTQSDGFALEALEPRSAEAASLYSSTGTEVELSGFDSQWVDETFAMSPSKLSLPPSLTLNGRRRRSL